MLGLGSTLTKAGKIGLPIVTDNLALQHKYVGGEVHQVSTGAAAFNVASDGTDHIDVGTIAIADGDITMCAWVYVTDWVSYSCVISNRGNGSGDPGVQIRHDHGTQKFELLIDDGVDSSKPNAGELKESNRWYHVCGVWDRDDKQYLYVDGVLEASGDITNEAGSLAHSTSVFIGKNAGSIEYRGYICNVGYWNRTLSQAEIKSIMWKNYGGLTSAEKTSLVSWWNLNENANDNHGSNNGTLS